MIGILFAVFAMVVGGLLVTLGLLMTAAHPWVLLIPVVLFVLALPRIRAKVRRRREHFDLDAQWKEADRAYQERWQAWLRHPRDTDVKLEWALAAAGAQRAWLALHHHPSKVYDRAMKHLPPEG